MIRRPPRSTRTDTPFPTRRSSDLLAALEFPRLTSRVVDNADLLSAEQERRLVAQLRSHEEASSNQLVVVTLPSLQGTAIDDFGYQLGRQDRKSTRLNSSH